MLSLLILLPLLLSLALAYSPRLEAVSAGWEAHQLALLHRQPAEAAQALEGLLRLQPWRTDLWELVGLERLAAGDPAGALTVLREARSTSGLTVKGSLGLAQACEQQMDSDCARLAWSDLARRDDLTAIEYREAYQAQVRLGDWQAMEATLARWSAAEPEDAFPRYRLGLLQVAAADEQGLATLEQAAGLAPEYTHAYLTLREDLLAANRVEDLAYRLVAAGRALAGLNEWRLAERAFFAATDTNPSWAEAWAFLAEARQRLGGSGDAELDQAEALDDQSLVVQAMRALYWRRQGQPERAVTYLHAAANAEPQQAVWQIELGNTYAQAGDLGRALESYRQATVLEPDNPQVWQALAAFSTQHNIDAANTGLAAARQALVLAPNDPAALDLLGWVLFTLEDLDSAERFLQQSVEQAPDYAPAHLHLGQVYLAQGRPDRAYEQIEMAAQLGGDTAVGRLARRLLQDRTSE